MLKTICGRRFFQEIGDSAGPFQNLFPRWNFKREPGLVSGGH